MKLGVQNTEEHYQELWFALFQLCMSYCNAFSIL